MDLENLSSRICTVFGKSTRKCDTTLVYQWAFLVVLHNEHLTHVLQSVHKEASRRDGSRNILRKVPGPASILSIHVIGSRQYRIVRDDPLSNFEILDVLTNSCDNSDYLMACQRVRYNRVQLFH